MLLADDRTGDEVGDLLFFGHLPADEFFDVGMIEIEHDHLGRAPRGAAGLDRAGGPIADAQERHQPELVPPPESFSPSPRSFEKLEPVPLPYLKMRASRTHRSMMPPSFTRSSLTD